MYSHTIARRIGNIIRGKTKPVENYSIKIDIEQSEMGIILLPDDTSLVIFGAINGRNTVRLFELLKVQPVRGD